MDFLGACTSLACEIATTVQNGESWWGTLGAPKLANWIGSEIGGDDFCPWGQMTAHDNNPYTDAPLSATTRYYDFNVSRGVIAPDGYERDVLLVNDQFPGPLIEANWGDWIQVTVHNQIEDEGTGMHWHGFLQTGTPYMDGTPGVTQCPIAPGHSFTYRFKAELYGTSWYHAHYSAQYSGGLFGPMVVHGPRNVEYDVDLGPIMVNDWWHEDYHSVVEEIMAPYSSGRTVPDSNLINGKMRFDCAKAGAKGDYSTCHSNAGLSRFVMQPGKTHRLRFINSGSQAVQRISLDDHVMTVIANDFTPIEPYDTKVVVIGVGQRVDVIVKARSHAEIARHGATRQFWLRADADSCQQTKVLHAVAAVHYTYGDDVLALPEAPRFRHNNIKGSEAYSERYNDYLDKHSDSFALPRTQRWPVKNPRNCANDDLSLTKPFYPMAVREPSFTHHMDIGAYRNSTGHFLWEMGGVSARLNFNSPTLLDAVDSDEDDFPFTREDNVYNYGHNTSVRIIINNPLPAPHPMHTHGLNMYILSAGPGAFDPSSSSIDLSNPLRRDVQNIEPFGHLVLQIDADKNPGLWAFHCHIAWHASQGMFAQLLLMPEVVRDLFGDVPLDVEEGCEAWDEFTEYVRPPVDQIDSGLRV